MLSAIDERERPEWPLPILYARLLVAARETPAPVVRLRGRLRFDHERHAITMAVGSRGETKAAMRHRALGLVELTGWSPTLLALDAMEKAGDVQLLQIELNDFLGACIKITGGVSDVRAAVDAARAMASRMGVDIAADVIPAPDEKIWPVVQAKAEFSPLLESNVVYFPQVDPGASENTMADNASFAIGMIETQGLTAVLEAIDCACKAAAVDVVGREKLGGGYVTVIIKGDVAAVKAAVAAGREAVDGLGKLIAAHVIARPSEGVLSLLPKS